MATKHFATFLSPREATFFVLDQPACIVSCAIWRMSAEGSSTGLLHELARIAHEDAKSDASLLRDMKSRPLKVRPLGYAVKRANPLKPSHASPSGPSYTPRPLGLLSPSTSTSTMPTAIPPFPNSSRPMQRGQRMEHAWCAKPRPLAGGLDYGLVFCCSSQT